MHEYTNSNTQLINVAEGELILAKLTELPPDDLIDKAETDDQLIILIKSDFYCQTLHAELKAYFNGQKAQLNGLSKEMKKFYVAERKYYLRMYELFREAWDELINFTEILPDSFTRAVEEAIKKQKIDTTHTETYKSIFKNEATQMTSNYPFKNPGELLAAIIENDVRVDITPCLQGRFDFNFRKFARLVREHDRKKQAGTSPEELQKINEKLVKFYGKEINELLKLKNFCISVCACAAVTKKDDNLTQAYEEYLTAREVRTNLLCRKFSNIPTLCFEKGERRYYIKEGGTLAPPSA